MTTTSITPSIGVTIGRQTRLYYAFITTASAALDAPSTVTLYAAALADVSGLATDEIALGTHRPTAPARLVLVDATELAWQRRRYREKNHLFAHADPVLLGANTLQHWLWQRLGAPAATDGHAHAASA